MFSMVLITLATCGLIVLTGDRPMPGNVQWLSDADLGADHGAAPGGKRRTTASGAAAFTNCAEANRPQGDNTPVTCQPLEGGTGDNQDCYRCQNIDQTPSINDQQQVPQGWHESGELNCEGNLWQGTCQNNECTMDVIVGPCTTKVKTYVQQAPGGGV
jgi:hypothetical protein